MWREHMKERHRIGFYCEHCDEYCLFEEELEEHMDSHVTEIECEEDLEEHTEIECVQCKEKFGSEDEITEHEDDGQEFDQYGEWLCYGTSLARDKKREHEITSEEGSEKEDMETHGTEIECVECNEKFESVDKVIEHENEGECDQCGKWLGCGTNLEKHKKREHEISSENKEKGKGKELRNIANFSGVNFKITYEE